MKTNKKSKWLKTALISTAGLTTLAAVPTMVCAASATSSNPKVNVSKDLTADPILKAASYVEITFKLSYMDQSQGAKITGDTVVKVKKGDPFGTIVKPTASYKGHTFKHWLYINESHQQIIMQDSTPCNHTGYVEAVFEQDKAYAIITSGPTHISAGDNGQFTAKLLPETAPEGISWYITDDLSNPTKGAQPYADIYWDGEVRAFEAAPEGTTFYVIAMPYGTEPPTTLSPTDPNVRTLKIVDPAQDPKYAKYIIVYNSGQDYYVDLNQFCGRESDDDKIMGWRIGTPDTEDPEEIATRGTFQKNIAIGSDITVIPNKFLADFKAFDDEITFNDNIVFIGDNFLDGADRLGNSERVNIHLPASVKYVGDFFMHGCVQFNQELLLNNGIKHIGDNFMEGCVKFAQPLTLPETLTEVGMNFLYNCNEFKQITINCPISSFEGSDGSFAGNVLHEIQVKCGGKASFNSLKDKFHDNTEIEEGKTTYRKLYELKVVTQTRFPLFMYTLGAQTSTSTIQKQQYELSVEKDGSQLPVSSWQINTESATGAAKCALDNNALIAEKDANDVWHLIVNNVDTSSWDQTLLNQDGTVELEGTLSGSAGGKVTTTIHVDKPLTIHWFSETRTHTFNFEEVPDAQTGGAKITFASGEANNWKFGFEIVGTSDYDKELELVTPFGWIEDALNWSLLTTEEVEATTTFKSGGPTDLSQSRYNTWKGYFDEGPASGVMGYIPTIKFHESEDSIKLPSPYANDDDFEIELIANKI